MFEQSLSTQHLIPAFPVPLSEKVAVLFVIGSALYCEGLRGLLSSGKAPLKNFAFYDSQTIGGLTPHIVVADESGLREDLFIRYPEARTVLVDNGLSPQEIRGALSRFRLHGIVSPCLGCADFRKALEKIHRGERWIEPEIAWQLLRHSPARPRSVKDTAASAREHEIIGFVCSGLSNKQIAAKLRLSEHTVKSHLNNIFRKFHLSSRLQLVSLFSAKYK